MNREASELWSRAVEALQAAQSILDISLDASASRSYYAAFYALSALYAFSGKQFSKHTAVQAAMNHDFIRPGKWPVSISKQYSFLIETRAMADYGIARHVTREEAMKAVDCALAIIHQVAGEHPEFSFTKT